MVGVRGMASHIKEKIYLAVYFAFLLLDLYGFYIQSGVLVFVSCACLAALILNSFIYSKLGLNGKHLKAITIESSGYAGEEGDNHKID
jgi:hypothetical protein